MVFSSLTFLIFFLPVVLALYYCIPSRWRGGRNTFLLIASLVFYAFSGVQFILLILAVIITVYLCGLLCGLPSFKGRKSIRKLGLVLGIVICLSLLGYFKYAGFFTENLNALGLPVPILEVTLPIGISFYTFQGLSYIIDVYRGDAPVQKNPLNVALYVALFPQLVAGPIVRYTTIADEIGNRHENLEDFSAGFTRFCFGLGKKMLLANPMAEIVDDIFAFEAAELSAGVAWVGAVAVPLQIYFDFSAYSDMAIGLGRMFGFHFLENFNYPLTSKSLTEFLSRWHISLGSWFRDYLYIPLGGSRCSTWKHIRNLAVVWLLTGLWHGAAWTYIFWGIWSLCFLLGEKYIWGKPLKKLPSFIRWIYAMLVVILGDVFFRSPDLGYAFSYFASLLGFGSGVQSSAAVYYLLEYWPEWLCAIVACLPIKNWLQSSLEKHPNALSNVLLTWAPKLIALVLLGLSYMKLVSGSFNPFVYFQF